MSEAPHAIPTMYHGTRFRSRLEARWAAFFDMLGFKWTYEPKDLDGYIPDFAVYPSPKSYAVKRREHDRLWSIYTTPTEPWLVEIKPQVLLQDLAVNLDKFDRAGVAQPALVLGGDLLRVREDAYLPSRERLIVGLSWLGGYHPSDDPQQDAVSLMYCPACLMHDFVHGALGLFSCECPSFFDVSEQTENFERSPGLYAPPAATCAIAKEREHRRYCDFYRQLKNARETGYTAMHLRMWGEAGNLVQWRPKAMGA